MLCKTPNIRIFILQIWFASPIQDMNTSAPILLALWWSPLIGQNLERFAYSSRQCLFIMLYKVCSFLRPILWIRISRIGIIWHLLMTDTYRFSLSTKCKAKLYCTFYQKISICCPKYGKLWHLWHWRDRLCKLALLWVNVNKENSDFPRCVKLVFGTSKLQNTAW